MTRGPRYQVIYPLVALAALACADDVPSMDGGDTQASTGEDDPSGDGDTGAALRPNWHEDIAPLIHGSCVGCHYEGGIAPFSLETYEQSVAWSALIDEVVADGLMPPWGALETDACQPEHTWRNDTRLSDEQKLLLSDWLAAGTPEGDPADAAPLPEPPSLELADTTTVLQNPSPFTVGGDSDSFICMAVDPGNDTDVWVTGVQMVPDNDEVVHHVLTYIDANAESDALIDENGTFPCLGFVSFPGATQISTWVPGAVPMETPEDVGFYMPAGSRIVMAYHYHPTGLGDEVDQSSIALRWTEVEPPTKAYMAVFGAIFGTPSGLLPGPNDPGGVPVFEIPPNVPDHTEHIQFTLPDYIPPIDIFTIGTHMHYIGVDMRIWIERDGEDICIIETPRWDFNWQRNYDVDAPVGQMPKVQGGDVINMHCTYDNTLANPFLVQALAEQGLSEPVTVTAGEQSLDEMCVMLVGVATDLPLDMFF